MKITNIVATVVVTLIVLALIGAGAYGLLYLYAVSMSPTGLGR